MNANEYIKSVLEGLKNAHTNEPEFLQATEEVFSSLQPVLEKRPDFIKANILERLSIPERAIMFKVSWINDAGEIKVNRGYRIQYNSAIGPYKGGLRFSPAVNLGVVKFLAFEQTFKNALTSLPIGGGKGGSDFCPKGKSDQEVMRFCQAFMMELSRYIGGNVDSPAGDIGVGFREIGYLFGYYKRLSRSFDAAGVTGKPVLYGGSLVRAEATGYGAMYFADNMLADRNEDLKGKRIAVSGYGNVAWGACKKARDLGALVITLSERKGYIVDNDGVNTDEKIDFLVEIRTNSDLGLQDYAKKFNCEYYPNEKPWNIPVDIALPCATENEIQLEDAKKLVANGVKYIVEGSNMPTSKEALQYFKEHGVIVAPGKAANAGGVSVSALEMSQNSMKLAWTEKQVDEELQLIIKNIYLNCKNSAEEFGFGYDLVAGANIAGFIKVAESMIAQGEY